MVGLEQRTTGTNMESLGMAQGIFWSLEGCEVWWLFLHVSSVALSGHVLKYLGLLAFGGERC